MSELNDKLQEILEQHSIVDVLTATIDFYKEPANFQPGSSQECYETHTHKVILDELVTCVCNIEGS